MPNANSPFKRNNYNSFSVKSITLVQNVLKKTRILNVNFVNDPLIKQSAVYTQNVKLCQFKEN